MGLLVIVLFKCDIYENHFKFSRLNSGRRHLVVLICLQCVPSLFVFFPPCRIVKESAAGHAIEGLSYVGLKYSALRSNFDLDLWSSEAFI